MIDSSTRVSDAGTRTGIRIFALPRPSTSRYDLRKDPRHVVALALVPVRRFRSGASSHSAVRFVSVDSILLLREERTCVSIHDGRGKRRCESDSPTWSAANERRFCSAKRKRTAFVAFLKVPVRAKIARSIPDGIRTIPSEICRFGH